MKLSCQLWQFAHQRSPAPWLVRQRIYNSTKQAAILCRFAGIGFPNDAARKICIPDPQCPDTENMPVYISKTNRYRLCHVQVRILL
jgi:hypothetical protein